MPGTRTSGPEVVQVNQVFNARGASKEHFYWPELDVGNVWWLGGGLLGKLFLGHVM